MTMDPLLLLLVFGLVAVASASQAVTGFGFVLLTLPVLALVFGPHTAVVACVVVGIVLTAWGWWQTRADVSYAPMKLLMIGCVIGLPVGLLVFTRISERGLLVLIGILIITSALLLVARVRIPSGRGALLAAGTVSGALLVTTGTNGPPMAIALQAARLTARQFRGTLQALMTVQSILAVALFAGTGRITSTVLTIAAVSVPAIVIGWYVGERVFRRLSAEAVRRVVLGALFINGAVLVASALRQ